MARKPATKIKSHEQLGISYAEYGALLGVRAMLQNKVLTHQAGECLRPNPGKHEFNMATKCKTRDCGSVGCIGGNMGLILGKNNYDIARYVSSDSESPLRDLFFPPHYYNYNPITPAQSITAIDNFLRTGKPMWRKVLGSAPAHNAKSA